MEQQRELVAVTREQLESEMEAVRQERAAAEHAAQPTLIPSSGGSYTGVAVDMPIDFRNAGADATNVVLWLENHPVVERRSLLKGETIRTRIVYNDHAEMKDLSGFITYFDAMGERRARRFTFLVVPGGGPNQRNAFDQGKIEATLYKPPFPWEQGGANSE